MGTETEMVTVVDPIFRRGGLILLREGKLEEIRVELSLKSICSINDQAVKEELKE